MKLRPIRLQMHERNSESNHVPPREPYESQPHNLRYEAPLKIENLDLPMFDPPKGAKADLTTHNRPKGAQLNLPMFDTPKSSGIQPPKVNFNASSPEMGRRFQNWAVELPITLVQDYACEYYNREPVIIDAGTLNKSWDSKSVMTNRSYMPKNRQIRNAGTMSLHNGSSFSTRAPQGQSSDRASPSISLSLRDKNDRASPSVSISLRDKNPNRLLQETKGKKNSRRGGKSTTGSIPFEVSSQISGSFFGSDISSTMSIFDGPKIELLHVDNSKLDVKKLQAEFLDMQERAKYTPIQAYEVLLYGACRRVRELVGTRQLNVQAIEDFYPLVKLQETKGELSFIDQELFKLRLKEVNQKNPTSNEELKTMGLMLRVINALLIHWNIAQPKKYSFRFKTEYTRIFHIDLTSFTKGIVVLDVLWLCFSPEHYVLMGAKQNTLAVALRSGFLALINSLVALNKDADFHRFPSIEGYATYMLPALAQLGFRPIESEKPDFAELALPNASNRKKAQNKPIAELYERMRVFENVYKQFEATLLKELPKS